MKRILLFALLLSGLMASGQSKGYLRYDSTYLQKVGGNNELILQNGSRGVYGGLLTNVNNLGLTRFIKTRKSGDTLFIGVDTLTGFGGVAQLFGKEDQVAQEDRLFTGNNGLYGMIWDSMKLVNFNVFGSTPGDKGELNLTNTLSSLGWSTDNGDRSAYLYADPSGAKLQAYDLSESKEINLLVDKDSIYTTYAQGTPDIATIGDDKVVTRSPGGALRYAPATAIGGKFGRTGDVTNTTSLPLAFDNQGQNFTVSNMKLGTFEADDSIHFDRGSATNVSISDSFRVNLPQKWQGGVLWRKNSSASQFMRFQDEFGADAIQWSWNRSAKIYFQYLYDTLGAFHFQQFNAARTANWLIGGFRRFLGSTADSALWRLGIWKGAYGTDMEYEFPTRGGYLYYDSVRQRLRVNTGYGLGLYKSIVHNTRGWALDTAYLNGAGDSLAFEYEHLYGARGRYAVKLSSGTGLPSGADNGESVVYDGGAAIWDVKSSGPNTYYYFNDFPNTVGTSGDGNGVLANNTSGTSSVGSPDANNHPGILGLQTSTGATNAAGVNTGLNSMSFGGGTWEMNIGQRSPANASDVTDTYQVIIGFFDAGTANQTDGVYFLYDAQGVSTGSAASANWQIVTASNSTRTFTTTSSAVGTSTYSTLRISVNAAGTLVTFYVNGVSVGTSSTNIPTGTSRGLGFGARIIKSAGTTNRQQFIDYMEVKSLFTSAR